MMPVTAMTPPNQRREGRSTAGGATDSTITLLPLAARGDRQAIELLVERMRPYLRRFGHGRLPRWARARAETEDLVQESLIRSLRHLPRFEHQTIQEFRAWLNTVFRNLVIDETRVVGRTGLPRELPDEIVDPALSPEEQAVDQSRAGVFEQALRQLEPEDRLLIVYRLQHGYSFQELADKLGKPSADAARMAYNRVLTRFRDQVKRLTTVQRPRSG